MAEFTFAPLTPASFLDRAAAVFADRIAIVDGERTFTYREMSERCRRLTAALAASLDGNAGVAAASRSAAEALLDSALLDSAALSGPGSGRHRKQEQAVAAAGLHI